MPVFGDIKVNDITGKIKNFLISKVNEAYSASTVTHIKNVTSGVLTQGMILGLGDKPEYVFTNANGGFIVLNNWRKRIFWKALEKAELRRIRIHDIRHTYTSLRINKGDNIADVSKQLGHHSATFTMKIYDKW
jgi:integrase